jgi:hypothetical protein
MDSHHEIVVGLGIIDPPCSAEPTVIWGVRGIVNDPGEGIFSTPVTVCERARMAWSRIALEGFDLLLPRNRHYEGQKKQEQNYSTMERFRHRIDFTRVNSSNREVLDARDLDSRQKI